MIEMYLLTIWLATSQKPERMPTQKMNFVTLKEANKKRQSDLFRSHNLIIMIAYLQNNKTMSCRYLTEQKY